MASCSTTPIQTQFDTVTTTSTSTSFSDSLSTIPPLLTTSTTTSCVSPILSASGTLCGQSTVITSVSTVSPAQTTTVQVPVEVPVAVTTTVPTNTVFSTSCSTPAPPPPPITNGSVIISTPPPTNTVIASSSTLPDGQVSIVYSTQVITLPPTTYLVGATGLPSDRSASKLNIGAVVGGTVGGVAFLAIIALLWWLRRRRTKFNDLFDEKISEDDLHSEAMARSRNKRFSIDTDNQPKPYQYGLVGRTLSPPGVTSEEQQSFTLPPLGFSTATRGLESQPSSRRPSTSVGSMAPFLASSSASHRATSSDDRGAPAASGSVPAQAKSDAPQIAMDFDGWANEANDLKGAGSPVSFEHPRMLKVVNEDNDFGH